ncbi:MAG TPA: hypothetical protein V6C58_24610 [Allocoleopsis sp.]
MIKTSYYIAGYEILKGEYSMIGVSPFSPQDALHQLSCNTNFKCIMLALKNTAIDHPDFSKLFHSYKQDITKFPLVELRLELEEFELNNLLNKNYEGLEHE